MNKVVEPVATATLKEDGGPAFACAAENGHQSGMSMRDYFAAAVVASFANRWPSHSEPKYAPDLIARDAYRIADAMIAERSKATPSSSPKGGSSND